MRRVALLVMMTGCWPYIPSGGGGPPADSAIVVGGVSYNRYLGAYWQDGTPQLSGWVATVDPPENVFMVDAFGTLGSCVRNPALPTWWPASFATNGSGTASIASSTIAIPVDWDVASNTFTGEAPSAAAVESGSWFSVSGVNAGPYGAYVVDNAVYLPGDLQVTAPPMAGASMASVVAGDVAVQWSGANDASEIGITVILSDSAGTTLEVLSCRSENSGSFVIPASQFTLWANATQAVMAVAAVHQADSRVDFSDVGGTRMMGSNTFVGAFVPQ